MQAFVSGRDESSEADPRFADLVVRGFVSSATAAALAALVVLGHATWALALVAVFGTVAICAVDTSYLPAVALVAFSFIPVVYLNVNTKHGALNPEIVIILVLLARFIVERRRLRWGRHLLPLVLLTTWVATMTVLSTVRSTSEAWTLDFVVLLFLPSVLLANWAVARERLLKCWLATGGFLGLYGVIEFALKRNLVYGHIFGDLGQVGGVYRITTALGHPLVNGLFFCVVTLLGIGRIIRGCARWEAVALVFSGCGLLATGSRGALLAFAVALIVVVCGFALGSNQLLRRRAAIVGVAFLAVASGGAVLASTRTDLASSTTTRLETYQAGEMLTREYWPFGAGPGVADQLKTDMPVGQAQRFIESSALELAAELGLPGIVLILWLLLTVVWMALRRQPEVAGAIVGFAIAASTFDFWDEYRPGLLILGLLIGLGTGVDQLLGDGTPRVRAGRSVRPRYGDPSIENAES
jgi:hypothetical protein